MRSFPFFLHALNHTHFKLLLASLKISSDPVWLPNSSTSQHVRQEGELKTHDLCPPAVDITFLVIKSHSGDFTEKFTKAWRT